MFANDPRGLRNILLNVDIVNQVNALILIKNNALKNGIVFACCPGRD